MADATDPADGDAALLPARSPGTTRPAAANRGWSPPKLSRKRRVTTTSVVACAIDFGDVRWTSRAKKASTSGRAISAAARAVTSP